jgi:hypothetical protein
MVALGLPEGAVVSSQLSTNPCLEVGGDAQMPPFPVRFDPREIGLLHDANCIASKQQPKGMPHSLSVIHVEK